VATILIVDDEGPIRSFLALLLKDAGHLTRQAINGADALKQMETERPDLVIADVMMPVLGGAQLCRLLKDTPRTHAIPVILMSAAGPHVAEGADADAFIAKPFNLDEMEAAVERWLPQEAR
jgi:CheY-like chemotaxis protein